MGRQWALTGSTRGQEIQLSVQGQVITHGPAGCHEADEQAHSQRGSHLDPVGQRPDRPQVEVGYGDHDLLGAALLLRCDAQQGLMQASHRPRSSLRLRWQRRSSGAVIEQACHYVQLHGAVPQLCFERHAYLPSCWDTPCIECMPPAHSAAAESASMSVASQT